MKSGASRRALIPFDFALIFLLAAALIWPLFKATYLDKWASIESIFISDARFLKEHWPHPQWLPLWYGGTRFDYIYPPALRYGTAALAKFGRVPEARAYHLYTAFFYCIGIAGVFLFVRVASGLRGPAWLAATASALLSPIFLFVAEWRGDSWLHHPTRLGVLVRYGEGPHMTSFALLPIALIASYLALREWRPGWVSAAAVLCALVVSNNFYGGVALLISFPILLWSVWITHQDRGIWARALAITALTYGLTAVWLTPSYLRVTTANLRLVSHPGNTWSIWLALVVGAAYIFATAKLARGKPERFYPVFVAGFALFFSLNTLGHQFFNFRVAGEPSRFMPEEDLALILLALEGLRRLWNAGPVRRAVAVAVTLAAFATAIPYVRHAWRIIVPDPNYRDRVEYKLTGWMAEHMPEARAVATGSVRFWYTAWFPLQQMGGGSDQGVSNQLVNLAYTQITNDSLELALQWMQSFGVDALIVHDKKSQEIYHDFIDPQRFATLPVLFDNREGDVIYRVPRRFPDLARVVDTARVRSLPAMGPNGDPPTLRAYAEALEQGPAARAVTAWERIDGMRIQADVAGGQSIVVQVAYDPQWRAKSGETHFPIRKDPLGQMLIETPPGRHDIRLEFETPLENRIGKGITLLSLAILIALVVSGGSPALQRIGIPATPALLVGLFLLNVALNIPLFQAGEMPYRDSIEGGYAATARFFAAHPSPWGWNPTQYCGLPAQFTYMPGLPYLAAAMSRLMPVQPDYAYRIVSSTFACLGPVTLFVFVFYFTRNRWWALAAALAYTFFSPSYYLVHAIDVDRGESFLPWRLQVLLKYGEGPHNAGLTLLPLALVAVWEAGISRGFGRVFLAALLLAAVCLTNWVAALALAVCCLAMLLTLAGSVKWTGFRAARVFAAAAVGYGLACFWLTPSFIRVIVFNWPVDAFNYRLLRPQILLLAGIPVALLLSHFLFTWLCPRQYYFRFVTLAFLAFAWVVLWFYSTGVDTIPESRRYALEMELFLFLVVFELFRLILRAPIVPLRYFAFYAALAIFLSGWGQFQKYCTQGFTGRWPAPVDSTIEYRVAEKLAELKPRGRVFASGGLRFRLNSWFEIPQVGGGFESGLTTRMPLNLSYQIRTGVNSAPEHEGEDAIRELKTLGAEYVVVHGPQSREHYRDFKNPHKFDGLLEVVWREEDDTIYRVPFSSLAYAVSPNELSIWHPMVLLPVTDPYSRAIGDAGRPKLAASWRGSSSLDVQGPVAEGQLVSVQVNYDPDWRAEQDGRPIAVERDKLGFMVLHANASPAARIRLRYRGSLEQRLMAAVSALFWIGSLAVLVRTRYESIRHTSA
jgi:hypothetical protein